ncbi:flavin-containing monooxygenase [Dietzia maris]|uniref:flavin-containing monooxygenase n=1 Tax=Dietzia maris TaxID=37915 RepID=UPI00223BCD50|nr:NAD(P)/FAD-dependent oxidoreductase [Dietzia maris]MCT1433493.1 NAD(P)/FAD-dependent oxidoreductase [Dietzia maris]MCT1520571.1 NAD(P)/FAD-dependent oxidoreductase [Dietzia maris]
MSTTTTRIIIIGAGVAGIAAGAMLRRKGINDFLILERGDQFGGVWRENIYPGVECDVQSHLYSYSFRPHDWSKTYAGGSEIKDYLATVATEEGLDPHARFDHTVTEMRWDESSQRWLVETDRGRFECSFLIPAAGSLSELQLPAMDGLDEFAGEIVHSAAWDPSIDLTGKKVAVVGTGASAIQVAPAIAEQVGHLTIFQRTAPWIAPRVDIEYSPAQRRMWEELPETLQEYRQFLFWFQEARFPERIRVRRAIERMTSIADGHRTSQLSDPELLQSTRPNYEVGCKRILLSNTWYPTLERENVTLVPHAAAGLTSNAVVAGDGQAHETDVMILCSGFDTVGLPVARLIYGQGGICLAESWSDGAHAFGGMSADGFPNLFLIGGPNVGLGFGSMFFMIETQAEYIAQAIDTALTNGIDALRVRPERVDQFVKFIDERAARTVWLNGGCNSFYIADGTGHLSTLWPDFMSRYRLDFQEFNSADYVSA